MTETANKDAARAWRYPPRSEHPDAEIFVYRPWCKACGICYELCPAGVLTSDKAGQPVVSNPEACRACYLCEALCPDMAITVYRERAQAGGSAAPEDAGGPDGPVPERAPSKETGGNDG